MEIYIKLKVEQNFLFSLQPLERKNAAPLYLDGYDNKWRPDNITQTGFYLSFPRHPSSDEINLFTCSLERMFIQTHALCTQFSIRAHVKNDTASVLCVCVCLD